MDLATWVQILDKAVCILQWADNIEKGMNLPILSPAMGEQ